MYTAAASLLPTLPTSSTSGSLTLTANATSIGVHLALSLTNAAPSSTLCGSVGPFPFEATSDLHGTVDAQWREDTGDMSLVNIDALGFVVGQRVVVGACGSAGVVPLAMGVVGFVDYTLRGVEDVGGEAVVAEFGEKGRVLVRRRAVGANASVEVGVQMDGVAAGVGYRVATRITGATVGVGGCGVDVVARVIAGADGKVACVQETGDVKGVRSLLGKSVVVLAGDAVEGECEKEIVVAVATVGVFEGVWPQLGGCVVTGAVGSAVVSIALEPEVHTDNDLDASEAKWVVPVLATVTAVVAMGASVAFSCWKAWQGYRRVEDEQGGVEMRRLFVQQ
ncbi:hypothetical protein HDU98_009102 [Podochytrium sp. JEL0797]|nr:hypothetical protein HDU98_009102 [Podochytrium sp. JEL0797]